MTFADWKEFVAEQALNIETKSGETETPGATVIIPLLHQGLLAVAGVDAARFLQGQLTCNVNLASEGNSILCAACNPQGRMYSSFRLIPVGDPDNPGFFLRMREDIIKATLGNFNKYIVFYKAKATDESMAYAGFGLSGPKSTECITRIFGQAPTETNQQINIDRVILLKLPGPSLRYECWLPLDKARHYWQLISSEAVTGSINDWILADITSGIGEVSEAVSESFIPQMLNYDRTGAVSFNKGCYTGQEVVARLQYRGKSKRSMVMLTLEDGPDLIPGQQLHPPEKAQNCATIVSSAKAKQPGTQCALAVLSSEFLAEKTIELCLKDECFSAQITRFTTTNTVA